MAVTETDTNLALCLDALRKIGVVAVDESASADEIEVARRNLNRMIKGWQNKGMGLWLETSMSIPVTTSAAHTLNPVRPLSIETVRFKRGSIETPMLRMSRDEYDHIPQKDSTGIPTQFFYDKQREAARLYVWPLLGAVTSETLEISYTREFEDVVLTDECDIPSEWYDAVVYNLAERLSDDYMVDAPKITARASQLLEEAIGFDREGSVFFAGDAS